MLMEAYSRWLEKTAQTQELYEELKSIEGNAEQIEDRFYRELEFGTAGLRGVLGAGTNRMNIFTVGKATQGLSNYLKETFAQPSVAIGYDSRIHADLFAEKAAEVLAANGIKVYLYPVLMPTPAVSFAVRDLHCSAGVMITASHNPAKYNGYKVYGPDGCQITAEAAKAIQEGINATDPFDDVQWADFKEALESGCIEYLDDAIVQRYLAAIDGVSVLPEGVDKQVSIVYTPLNGAGLSCVPRCLREHGFTNFIMPPEQDHPDGNFPTCPYPNPEIREALEVGLALCKKTGSDLLLATDPDCDRVGVAVRDGEDYRLISGNEMGVLLLDFICKMRIANGTMPTEPLAVKTIVTTPMAAKVAEHYGVKLVDVLTGFKYIGEQIAILEDAGHPERYIFGFEESYGYLSGGFVRDKDAVNSSMLICEMFVWYKSQGKSLVDVLRELYAQHGFYESRLMSFTFEGSQGFAVMQNTMAGLRNAPPKEVAGYKVVAFGDYQTSQMQLADGTAEKIDLPKSNVLRFFLDGGMEAVVRPSGTEPKLKVYVTAIAGTQAESSAVADKIAAYFKDMMNSVG